ncbi:WD40-repeat-containing domain protein [Gamsiella multidivaricata]|uniref:WD40-repeat-containing domain protein n=1 Tax=Gamsiella multidivaricata TaxID=101098 RepID=UPI00221EF27D|nr:WD40-repeat-containing domain protein [Gamsiella multidivaricata]KAI7823292.1 WD40-repeat-containing domain protein [Gamsiella multidivaricata]
MQFNASLVCQLFYHVVNADSCWKEAFIKFFGASVPFKRLDPKSWRGEYIKRTRLLRRWEKGRGSNVLIDPKIGEITKLWIGDARRSDERWFLAGGLAEGVVAKCNPLLGKVQKDAVLRMAHVAHVEVAVMAMDQHRVVWGLTTGEVSLTTLAYGTAGQMFQAFVGFHNGPVTCIKLVPNHLGFFLTGGVDGVIKLWDVFRARCVREFTTGTSATQHNRPKIDHICCEPGSRIVAGTSTGEIYVWEADIKAIMAPPPSSTSEVSAPIRSGSSDNISTTMSALPAAASTDPSTSVPSMMPKVVKLPEEPKGVKYLEVEFMADRSGLILTHAADARVMHLYSLHTLEHLATLKSPAHFTPITAVHWDSLKHEQPMISLSNSVRPAMSSIPHVRQGMPSLLATGDQSGNICLWYLADIMKRQDKNRNLHPSQARQDALELEPTCVLKAHDSKVSSLFVDKLIIVSGSADGSAKAWNPVNGKLISVLSTGYIRGHDINDTNSSAVKCLAVNSMQCRGILSIGRLVRSWDFSPDAGLAKEKHRRNMAKKQVQYSGGPKNRIQNYIRHSLEESVSLKQLEEDAKDRREQLHRRYNNLEGLNMVDMTDEEVVEYVMMLSKEHDDQEAAQLALEMQQIHEMEEELALKRQIQSQIGIRNGGEGPSKSAAAWNRQSFEAVSSNSAGIQDDFVTEQEMEEEEELVRRAIAMSMLDMESSSSSSHQDHFHQEHSPVDSKGAHIPDSYEYKPINWGPSDLVDVDTIGSDELERQEDHQIVQSILRELEEEDAKEHNSAEARPSISQSASAPIASSRTTSLPSPSSQPLNSGPTSDDQKQNEPQVKKMTWSMVARTNPGSSATAALSPQRSEPSPQQPQPSSRPLAIIKQYPRSASQEEIEDEDTQLARILSLSMVEK